MTWELILARRSTFLYTSLLIQLILVQIESFVWCIDKAIRNGDISEVYSDSYFNTKNHLRILSFTVKRIDTTDAGREQINAGQGVWEYIWDRLCSDVTQYKIKGYWYFDKRQSELKYRLLGICPITPDNIYMNSDERIISICFGYSVECYMSKVFYDKTQLCQYHLIKFIILDILIAWSTKKCLWN
jgi:hypothetical protein